MGEGTGAGSAHPQLLFIPHQDFSLSSQARNFLASFGPWKHKIDMQRTGSALFQLLCIWVIIIFVTSPNQTHLWAGEVGTLG